MKISIIIPTLGRPTLRRAVQSALASMSLEDELIVVGDGPISDKVRWVGELYPRAIYYETPPTRCWGAAQLDRGMGLATGDWLMFLPDDDTMTFGACDAVRCRCMVKGVHVFACLMQHWDNRVLQRSMRVCEVTASQIVVPRGCPATWVLNDTQTFDHAFLVRTLALYGQAEPWYHDEVICIADQHNEGRVF